jgi:hypothetical protein
MNPENTSSLPSQEKPNVCIEVMPSEPALIQFIGHNQTYSFPKSDFHASEFGLKEKRRQNPQRPPQELLFYGSGVALAPAGWCLDALPERLARGRINFIRAQGRLPADMIFKEPLVCSIHILWRSSGKSIALLPSEGRS